MSATALVGERERRMGEEESARREQEAAQRRERQEAQRREREQKAVERLNARLRKPEHQRCKRAALEATTLCALLMGPTGVGKTEAAHYMVRHANACWMRAIDLCNAEKRHGLGKGEPPEIYDARHARVLVIDDVGWGENISALYDVLDVRCDKGLPTIITTGLTRAELTERLSAALVRRIVDQHCTGADGGMMPPLVVDCFTTRNGGS